MSSADGVSRGPGTALRAARKAMNVEPREVADALNLPLTVVVALEEDDFDSLPNPIFARGYVRSYAKLLELDPEPLVVQYPVPETAAESIRPNHPQDHENPWAQVQQWFDGLLREKPKLVLGVAAGVGVVILALLLSWLLGGESETQNAGGDAVEQATASSANPNPNVRPRQGLPAEAASSEDATGDLGGRSAIAASLGGEQVGAASGDTDAADAGEILRLNAGDDRLAFTFSEECWVDIQSGDGASLYSDLGRPNRELSFIGGGPFRILLGYAPGVNLSFNGESVALAPHTRNNVATLVVGQ